MPSSKESYDATVSARASMVHDRASLVATLPGIISFAAVVVPMLHWDVSNLALKKMKFLPSAFRTLLTSTETLE